MRWYVSILIAVVALFAVGAIAQEQAAQAQQLTPEQALQVVAQATGDFKGTRNDHIMIEQSLNTLQRALAIYRQYVP